MAALGSTSDPNALVPGDPAAVRADASTFSTGATDLESAADALAAVRVDDWVGDSADAFWGVMSAQPRSWRATADALTEAAGKLTGYADVLTSAQSSAATAIARWDEAQAATASATQTYNAQVASYNTAARTWAASDGTGPRPVPPGSFVDPGAAGRTEAEEILAGARDAVQQAGDDAAQALGRIVVSDQVVVRTDAGTEIGASSGEVTNTLFEVDPETGERKIGLVSAEGKITWFTASAEVEARYGAWFAKADAAFEAGSLEGEAGIGIEENTLVAEASGSAAIIRGTASASAGGEYGHVGAEAEAYAGAYAEASVKLGAEGAGATVGAFAGAKVEGSAEAEVAGVGGKATGELWAGWGAEADLGLTQDRDGAWTLGGRAGVAAGLGGSVGFELTVDPAAVAEAVGDAVDWVGSLS
jgi:hypothetical protein